MDSICKPCALSLTRFNIPELISSSASGLSNASRADCFAGPVSASILELRIQVSLERRRRFAPQNKDFAVCCPADQTPWLDGARVIQQYTGAMRDNTSRGFEICW